MQSLSCLLWGQLLNTCLMFISHVSCGVNKSGSFTCWSGEGSTFMGMMVRPFIQTCFVFMVHPVHSMKS